MAKPKQRTDKEIAEIYDRQAAAVYRLCLSYLQRPHDAEDAVQETFLRLIRAAPAFQNAAHETGWLIRTAGNVCKSMLRSRRRAPDSLELHAEAIAPPKTTLDAVRDAVLALPERYKSVVYLYYYEGLSGAEAAKALRLPPSTVRNRLRTARRMLKMKLGEDVLEE